MSELVKNNGSSSKPKTGGSKRKYPRPDEAGSKFRVLRDQRNNNNNQNPPPPPAPVGATATTKSGSDNVVAVGQSFSGTIDEIFSNSPILKGDAFNPKSHQVSAEIVLEESRPSYSSSSSSSSQVEHIVAKPLESSSSGTGVKVVPVVFEPTNDLLRLRKGKGISGNYTRNKDSLLNRPSPAIWIPPPHYLRNEGTSAGSKFTPIPLPDIGFGREGREIPTVGGEFGINFKEAAEVFNEKIMQYVLSQQNFRKKDS